MLGAQIRCVLVLAPLIISSKICALGKWWTVVVQSYDRYCRYAHLTQVSARQYVLMHCYRQRLAMKADPGRYWYQSRPERSLNSFSLQSLSSCSSVDLALYQKPTLVTAVMDAAWEGSNLSAYNYISWSRPLPTICIICWGLRRPHKLVLAAPIDANPLIIVQPWFVTFDEI